MSGDPEQEYFADGIADDVLTTLSKIHELTVIARNSSFVFKGQAKDIREIGRILGARYVLEGSVRKIGNRVRLTAQLIDSLDGSHLWADRFDGGVDDVFDLQDHITQDIVAALEVQLTYGEQVRVWRKRSGSPLVYEYFVKARGLYANFHKHTHVQVRDQLERALQINPVFTPVLSILDRHADRSGPIWLGKILGGNLRSGAGLRDTSSGGGAELLRSLLDDRLCPHVSAPP